MEALNELAARAAKLPSQGEATVYTPLNIHTEPAALDQLLSDHQGVKVDVVGHQLVPRKPGTEPTGFQVPKPPSPVRKKQEKKNPGCFRLPAPLLRQCLRTGATCRRLRCRTASRSLIAKTKPEPKVPMEDWSFVRTKDRKAGWVVTRNLVMAIPDEVAQYSEGARITSYFALGDVQDEDQLKHHWLWTTARDDGMPYDFDSFRVLSTSCGGTGMRRHTSSGGSRLLSGGGEAPKFALIVRNEDGSWSKKRISSRATRSTRSANSRMT